MHHAFPRHPRGRNAAPVVPNPSQAEALTVSDSSGSSLVLGSAVGVVESLSVVDSLTGTGGATVSSRYRSGGQLFVDAVASSPAQRLAGIMSVPARASVAAPKDDYIIGVYGPNYTYVDTQAQWPWVNAGGDWIDATGTSQGSSAHFGFGANTVTSGSASYTASITTGLQAAFTRGRWNAYIVKVSASSRSIAAIHHATLPIPTVSVTYADSSTATLACLACVAMPTGTAYTQAGDTEAQMSASGYVALEFEMPTKAVTSATLNITLSQHTATSATVSGFLANPTTNAAPVDYGFASNYVADNGIGSHWSVLFAQRYADGSTLSDYIIPIGTLATNVFDVTQWDPGLYGGTSDTTKLPTAYSGVAVAGTNKWFHKLDLSANISLVNSSYSSEGFVPFDTGLGALRIVMPGSATADGGNTGGGGSTGSDLWALFPKAISGLTNEVYCRFSVRFGWSPRTLAATKMYRDSGGASAHYTVPSGKWGIGAHHWTYYGGNNRAGGANLGWSNRLAYYETPGDLPRGGLAPAVHSLDMSPYGSQTNMPFGKDGGLGSSFYPNQWYTVEVRIKLNTWVAGTGSADGVMQIWIDGKLDSTYTGWKYRDGAIDYVTATPKTVNFAPFREMGAMGLALNTYNGGVTPPDHDLVMFIGPMVAGKAQIGPLRTAATASSWPFTIPASSTIGTISSNLLNDVAVGGGGYISADEQFSLSKVLGAWGSASVSVTRTNGVVTDFLYWIFGGGHNDSGNDGAYAFRASTGVFERVVAPTTLTPHTAADSTHGEDVAGRPISTHTYQSLHGLDSDETNGPAFLELYSGASGSSAAYSGQGHRLPALAPTWERYGDVLAATAGMGSVQVVVKDTLRKKLVRFPSNGNSDFFTLDYSLASPTWQTLTQSARINSWASSYGSSGRSAAGIYDPVRDLYIAGFHYSTAGSNFCAISAAAVTGAWTELTFTGTGPSATSGQGLVYRSANDTFVLVDTSTSPPTGYYVLTPPASSPLTSAWTWSRVSMTGTSRFSNLITSGSGTSDHFNRWQYIAALDALVVCPDKGYAMEIWKL